MNHHLVPIVLLFTVIAFAQETPKTCANKVISDIEPKVKTLLSTKQQELYRKSLAWITMKCTNSGDTYSGSYDKCFLARFRDDQRYYDLPIAVNNAALVALYKCKDCGKSTPTIQCVDDVYKKAQPMIYVLDVNETLQAQVNGYQTECKKNKAKYLSCSENKFREDVPKWQKLVDISKEINAGLELCVE